jgi:coenzyme F420-0:L-glutamate ligase/coenzyme F420-1:gamma-L-glutamate ligase
MRAIPGIPDVRPGDALGPLVLSALEQAGIALEDRDILVVAHKVISKTEGRLVSLADVTPGPEARKLADQLGKDPRKVEVILGETRRVLRATRHPGHDQGVLICEHKLGFRSANAAVDESNIEEEDTVALLPEDPDHSAKELRQIVEQAVGCRVGVIISDTFGRPWRKGLVNVAIGLAGPPAWVNLCGENDAYGRPLRVSSPAVADEIAAAAGLLMSKADRIPVVLVRGVAWTDSNQSARDFLRPAEEDLFP